MADGAKRPQNAVDTAVIEQNAVALGVSLDVLMENAGRVVAEESTRHLPAPPSRVAVVAGTGNNGGDGSCAAFYLHQWGYASELWRTPGAEIRSRSARRCYERVERLIPVHVRLPRSEELRGFPLVIDALLGTGQSGSLRPPYREAVRAIRESGVAVLSIDEPTGIFDAEGLRPRWTVALDSVKEGMTPETTGEVTVRSIGIPPEARRQTGPGEFLFYPWPRPQGRGRHGRIVVVGGGPYSGAPALAALAALRSGVERATVIAPEPAASRIQEFSPDLVVQSIGANRFATADAASLLEFIEHANPAALIIGMGAGSDPETVGCLKSAISATRGRIPLVVDADALGALEPPERLMPDVPSGSVVATPNRGEYRRVFSAQATEEVEPALDEGRRIAAAWHLTLLAKGPIDVISDGTDAYANRHHPNEMTVAGAGDVLAGVVGGLRGQGVKARDAARLAAYWVGEAGARAAGERGPGLLASDVIAEIPAALLAGLRRVHAEG